MNNFTQTIKKNGNIILLAISLFAVSCANQPKNVSDNNQTPRKSYAEETESRAVISSAAHEVGAQQFVEISFSPGSSTLTQNSKSSLDQLIKRSANNGKIDEVLVLSWSDQELPSDNLKKLGRSEINLATKRNKAVENYIKENRSIDVDSYNMAEQPNSFSKWINTTDARLKRSLVAAGLPTTADDPQYPSKAGSSVVLVKLE